MRILLFIKEENKISLYEAQKPKSTTELMESPPVTYIDNTSAESPAEENRHRAEDRPFPEDTEKYGRTKGRCRRLMKKGGILILCTEEQLRRMHDFFDRLPKKSALEYKTLSFRFLNKEGRSGQKTHSGFYVPLDAAQDDRNHIQALSEAARNAGIEALIHITRGHILYEGEEKTAQVIGTKDGKSLFTLQTDDGYELLSQLIPFLQSETKGKRLWAMQYED